MQKTKSSFLKKSLAFVLSLAMLLSLLTVPAFADGEQQTCKVTVTNGASSADIAGEAYNSLHVYDENDPELEDFFGEKEFAIGSQISYYPWPNASDIRLTVVHNGETVEDRIVEQGSGGEPVTITLAGDLTITTEAVVPSDDATVTIDNQVGGDPTVAVDGNTVASGDKIAKGTHTILVQGDYITDELMEAYATLYVGGTQVGEQTEIGYDDAEFADVEVTGDVVIKIAPYEAPATYKVQYENRVEEESVTFNVMTVDYSSGTPAPKPIENEEILVEGTYVGVQVLNPLDKALMLVQYDGDGKEVDHAVIAAATEEEEGAGGLIIPELSSDVKFVLDYAPAPIYTVTFEQYVDGTPEVYVDDTSITSGADVEEGTHTFYVYGDYVTDELSDAYVTLLIGGEPVGEPVQIGMDGAEFANVAVTGDVVLKIGTPKFTVSYENKVTEETVTFNVRTVDYSGSAPAPKDIENGEALEEGSYVGVQVLNPLDKKLRLIQYDADGKEVDRADIDAASGSEEGAGGMIIPALDKDVKFVLDYAPITYKVTVTNGAEKANIPNVVVNGLHVYRTDGDDTDLFGEYELEAGTPIEIFAYPLASDIHLTIIHNGEILADKDIKQMEAYVDDDKIEFFDLNLAGDLEVVTTGYFQIFKEDKVNSDDVTFTVGSVDMTEDGPVPVELESGDKLLGGAYLAARAINDGTKLLSLKAYDAVDNSLIEEVQIMPGDANGIMYPENDRYVKFVLEETTGKLGAATLPKTSVVYNGKARTMTNSIVVTAKINGEDATLVRGRDYKVSYKNNTNAGTATVTITGLGSFAGSKLTKTFKITQASLKEAKVTAKAQTYTGDLLTPNPTVKLGSVTLKKGTDYTVTKYSNNRKAGTATIKITGKGNYKGSVTGTFTIKKAANPMTVKTAVKSKTVAQTKKAAQTVAPLTVKKAQGKVTYAKASGSGKLTIDKTTGKVTIAKGTKAGTYSMKVKVTAAGNGNYNKLTKTVTVKVTVK